MTGAELRREGEARELEERAAQVELAQPRYAAQLVAGAARVRRGEDERWRR